MSGQVARFRRAVLLLGMVGLLPTTAMSAGPEAATLGPVTAKVAVQPESPTIGDPITLTIEVTAEADVEVLMPEFGEALDRFVIVDFVPRQSVGADGRATFTQEYRLQPSLSGPQSIPPILIEFVDRRDGHNPAPDGQDAYELLTPRLAFEVQSVLSGAAQDLNPPLGELALPRSEPSRWGMWLVGGAAASGVAVALLALMLRGRRTPEASAYEIARRRLERLRAAPFPSASDIEPFFVELSDIVRTYLERRFRLRAPELTTEEFLEVASQSPDLTQPHQQTLRAFLLQADLVKFAGLQPSEEDIRKSFDAAERFLEETRESVAEGKAG